jgi:hypothetical protein
MNGVGFYEQLAWALIQDFSWGKKVLDKINHLPMDFFVNDGRNMQQGGSESDSRTIP